MSSDRGCFMRQSVIGLALILLMFSFVAVGCQSLTGETLGQNIDDTDITAYVKTMLTQEKAVNFTRVSVTTVKGVVHLTGNVESAKDKARAEQIASSVRGVRGVVNNLQVERHS